MRPETQFLIAGSIVILFVVVSWVMIFGSSIGKIKEEQFFIEENGMDKDMGRIVLKAHKCYTLSIAAGRVLTTNIGEINCSRFCSEKTIENFRRKFMEEKINVESANSDITEIKIDAGSIPEKLHKGDVYQIYTPAKGKVNRLFGNIKINFRKLKGVECSAMEEEKDENDG
ncbi:MAG: hypothetical protein ABEK36_03090 [Candidatus Aenigmatarchaeota archaeon]